MSISKKLMTTGAKGDTYVDDVFSTYLYTGDNGSDRDIVNGVDLDGEGGLVWIKNRTMIRDHVLADTERGIAGGYIATNSTALPDKDSRQVRAFNNDGFRVGERNEVNQAGSDYTSWTFRKAPSFFDVVTWVGDGVEGREIPHDLGVKPGMVIVKCTNQAGDWTVCHRYSNTYTFYLNSTSGKNTHGQLHSLTSSTFSVGNQSYVNLDGLEYVAYVFAHDNSEEGMIQCGFYQGNSNDDGPEINLGWEPQWLLVKNTMSTPGSWLITDNMRGMGNSATNKRFLCADSTDEERDSNAFYVTSNGFKISSSDSKYNNGDTYIYMAIRRPNKPAEEFSNSELFYNRTRIGTDNNHLSTAIGFPVDAALISSYNQQSDRALGSRMNGKNAVFTNSYSTGNDRFGDQNKSQGWDQQDAVWLRDDLNKAGYNYVDAYLRRAPGFFDLVSYVGGPYEGDLPYGVRSHSLGVAPELIWVKNRTSATSWSVYAASQGTTKSCALNGRDGFSTMPTWGTTFTDKYFSVNDSTVNAAGENFMAYLWASAPGICDIGTYEGTGADQEIDCGFTNGARWVLIKRADAAGDWMVFDTPRGITNGSSPVLLLNDNSSQSAGSSIVPFSKGFKAVTTSGLTTIDGAEYIYMAIA